MSALNLSLFFDQITDVPTLSIGTSDFSNGLRVSKHPKGFYSYQDNPENGLSNQNDIDLDIIKLLDMTMDVDRESTSAARD